MRELARRLREPSSWAGIGLLITSFGWASGDVWQLVVQAGTAIAGLLAMALRENGDS